MPAVQLVIFDCDGVLVDSELITNRIFAAMLNELGLPVTLDYLFEHFVGRSMAYCAELIAGMLQRPVPDGFWDTHRSRTTVALQAELTAVPGIETALDAISAAGVAYCVASSGSHEKMRTTPGITGLLPRFEGRLFSVTELARGKPAPDVFLHAAYRLGMRPQVCCVIEDTPTGVAAGIAADMKVFGYCGLTRAHWLREAGAHHTFSEMATLPTLLFA